MIRRCLLAVFLAAFLGAHAFAQSSPTISLPAITLPLGVALGGTGVTTSTGTGSVALSISPSFTGTLSAAAIGASSTIAGTYMSPTGTAVPSVGIDRPATNTLGFDTATTAAGLIDAAQHWRIGGAGTPTITSGNCGTGTNGTIVTGGNDQSFEVLIGAASTTTCTITFASAFITAPRAAELTPGDSSASVVGTTQDYVSALNTTTLVITGAALAGADYFVHVY